jgi:4-hydroxy-2-oxoheptanedioate aldolase
MLGSATAAEAVAASGLDYVVIDLEHGVFDLEAATDIVRAVQLRGAGALIRSGGAAADHLLRLLETGADGLLVSHVTDPETAAAVVRASLYPPDGDRGLSPYTRVHGFSHEDLAASMAAANEHLFVGVLLEGRAGLEALDQVLQVPRLDLVYFGIYDFTQSMGYGDQIEHPEVQRALEQMAERCAAANVACGTFVRTTAQAVRYRKLGLRFLAYGADGMILEETYRRIRQECLGDG